MAIRVYIKTYNYHELNTNYHKLILFSCLHRHHRRNVTFVDPHFRLGLITEDPDDNKFVDCAFAANAEYLVSDDKHFKILLRIPFPQLNLVKMAEFLEIIKTE